ncbi:hypothetical protein NK718_16420 [Alsobacter sp. SYSU M60028]|uniref:Uncharacterized protein n=1 Tax=Alsobacter ponti TaxID=2962936 RepID=A0ABT1LIR9_9HYPH|nr:hypothetical protein [Alsobacter ponti]MCP8940113.1 hypothetical protein [Alsobacter ponti]
MISKEDCIAFCGLTQEEVDAIAEHEHLGEIGAAALANYLMHIQHGPERVREMIVEDIRDALSHGRKAHAAELTMALRHFLSEHPEGRLTSVA